MAEERGVTDAPRRIFVTDCEGPLTRNDNAQEIAARFIPAGDEVFARLSRYDDFLADVVARPGYNAGDTLRLLVPFLVAYGVRDADMISYSAANVLLVPGADELLAAVRELVPAFIVSTSYTPYIRALCDVVGFPFENCRCTELSLDAWTLEPDEALWLRDWTERMLERPPIEIRDCAASADGLCAIDRQTIAQLDELFWTEMQGKASGEMLAAVHPVGGGAKLAALERIVADTGVAPDGVMYVGDSITDAPPFAAVRKWGGVSLSFNGNGYALAAAEFAAASADTAPTLALARAFATGGHEAVFELARDFSLSVAPLADDTRAQAADASCVAPPVHGTSTQAAEAIAEPGSSAPALPVVGVIGEAGDALAQASAWARAHVRGERIARLG